MVFLGVSIGGEAGPDFFGGNDDFECSAEVDNGAGEYLVRPVRETGQAGNTILVFGESLANRLVDQIGRIGIQAAVARYGNARHKLPHRRVDRSCSSKFRT